jgi:RNA polymerase sigma-70 factor (ECF subfamily)
MRTRLSKDLGSSESNKMTVVIDDDGEDRLVERAQRGDLSAYSELIRRYREQIYQTVYRLTRNHDDTDDLVQESFLRAFKELRRFRRRSGFYTWIYRIALNLSFNFLRKRKKEMGWQATSDRLSGPEKSALSNNPEAASLAGELRDRLDAAVDSLPRPYRSAFVLVVHQELTHGQAARVLGCSEKTVSWRMHTARKILQGKLRPFLKEGSDDM